MAIEMPLKHKYLIGGRWPKTHTAKSRTSSRRSQSMAALLWQQWLRHGGRKAVLV